MTAEPCCHTDGGFISSRANEGAYNRAARLCPTRAACGAKSTGKPRHLKGSAREGRALSMAY
jgi:hypothetical protein